MPVFSPGRDAIFTQKPNVALHINGFPDFYALLGTPRDASVTELETAITSRAADLLAASFSRGGKGEFLALLQTYVADFRPVLLDKVARFAYDEQLRRHETRDERALDFSAWKASFASKKRLSRSLQSASRGFKAHLKSIIWDAEYL